MPFELLDLRGASFAEIAFVNIGSFGGGRMRTDQGYYSKAFEKSSGIPVNMGDGIIEIIAFRSLTHLCCAMGNLLNAVVLGQVCECPCVAGVLPTVSSLLGSLQATEILMYVYKNDEVYMGVDGEPFKVCRAPLPHLQLDSKSV